MTSPMARTTTSSLFCSATAVCGHFSLAFAVFLITGCANLPDFSALEDDEMYLGRGEEFVTDSKYLAFALEAAGAQDVMEDDYYDANRGAYGEGYVGGFSLPGYQPSYNNPYRPFSNGLGLQSYFNPMSASGMGMAYGMGYGGVNSMNIGMNNGFGYNPYGYNPYGYNGWNNAYSPFGYYTPYGNNGWNNGYAGWGNNGNTEPYFGSSNDGSSGVTSFTRTPIMSFTNNGSNYNDEGVLASPKIHQEESGNAVEPTAVTPERDKRRNRWMQDSRSRQTDSNRGNSNWNSRGRSGGASGSRESNNSFSAPTNAPRSNVTRSSGSNNRSSGSSPRGSSSGNSRSNRGGGK